MKIKLALLITALACVYGCDKGPEATTSDATKPGVSGGQTSGTPATPTKTYTLADVPADLKGEAFEYYGLGNDKPVDMEVVQTAQPDPETGAQITTLKEVKDGEAIFEIERTGGLGRLGTQTVALRKDGIFIVGSSTAEIKSTGPELPQDLTPGKSWDNDLSLQQADGTKMELKVKTTVKGVGKFKTKAGEREGLRVVSNGSGTMKGEPVTIQGESWYVKGLGGVKSSFTYTTKNGQKNEISIQETK
jgi:hypothetical protein